MSDQPALPHAASGEARGERVRLNQWLAAVKSEEHGPRPSVLRHVCLTIADDVRGDGTDGAFPSLRRIAGKMGTTHPTVSRAVKRLQQTDWLELAKRPRQFGGFSWHYFLTLPGKLVQDVPITPVIGSPRTNSPGGSRIGKSTARIGKSAPGIGSPERSRSPSYLSLKESGTSPQPADAGSAALTDAERAVRDLAQRGFVDPDEIANFQHIRRAGLTKANVVSLLERNPTWRQQRR